MKRQSHWFCSMAYWWRLCLKISIKQLLHFQGPVKSDCSTTLVESTPSKRSFLHRAVQDLSNEWRVVLLHRQEGLPPTGRLPLGIPVQHHQRDGHILGRMSGLEPATLWRLRLTWMFVLQSSTTTAQLSAPFRLASGENRGRTDSFFLGAKIAENKY